MCRAGFHRYRHGGVSSTSEKPASRQPVPRHGGRARQHGARSAGRRRWKTAAGCSVVRWEKCGRHRLTRRQRREISRILSIDCWLRVKLSVAESPTWMAHDSGRERGTTYAFWTVVIAVSEAKPRFDEELVWVSSPQPVTTRANAHAAAQVGHRTEIVWNCIRFRFLQSCCGDGVYRRARLPRLPR